MANSGNAASFPPGKKTGGGAGPRGVVSACGSEFVRDTSSVSSNFPPDLPFGILMISLKKALMVFSPRPRGREEP